MSDVAGIKLQESFDDWYVHRSVPAMGCFRQTGVGRVASGGHQRGGRRRDTPISAPGVGRCRSAALPGHIRRREIGGIATRRFPRAFPRKNCFFAGGFLKKDIIFVA